MPVLPVNSNEILIFGCGSYGQICYMHLSSDSACQVIGFVQDEPQVNLFFDKPVYRFNDIVPYPVIYFYAAVGYSELNYNRTACYLKMKNKGFLPVSYFHNSAIISPDVIIGEHVYIMENSVLQTSVLIGENTIIYMGCNIAHHSKIGNNCFLAQGVNICGYVTVGDNCFIGANALIFNNISIGDGCVIAAGAVVKRDMPNDSTYTLSGEVIVGDAKNRFERWVNKYR